MKSLIKFTEEKSIMCELHGGQNPIIPMHLFSGQLYMNDV